MGDLERLIGTGLLQVGKCDWQTGDVTLDYLWGDSRQVKSGFKRKCYGGEEVLFYQGRAVLSLYCGNPINDYREPVKTAEEPAQAVCCYPTFTVAIPMGTVQLAAPGPMPWYFYRDNF
jgi:hypothetical protein